VNTGPRALLFACCPVRSAPRFASPSRPIDLIPTLSFGPVSIHTKRPKHERRRATFLRVAVPSQPISLEQVVIQMRLAELDCVDVVNPATKRSSQQDLDVYVCCALWTAMNQGWGLAITSWGSSDVIKLSAMMAVIGFQKLAALRCDLSPSRPRSVCAHGGVSHVRGPGRLHWCFSCAPKR
jgi:hypothetical protein